MHNVRSTCTCYEGAIAVDNNWKLINNNSCSYEGWWRLNDTFKYIQNLKRALLLQMTGSWPFWWRLANTRSEALPNTRYESYITHFDHCTTLWTRLLFYANYLTNKYLASCCRIKIQSVIFHSLTVKTLNPIWLIISLNILIYVHHIMYCLLLIFNGQRHTLWLWIKRYRIYSTFERAR